MPRLRVKLIIIATLNLLYENDTLIYVKPAKRVMLLSLVLVIYLSNLMINEIIAYQVAARFQNIWFHALSYVGVIHSGLDKGDCSARQFFADFRKGFDIVDHNVIIAELENLGIRPVIVRWIKDFLTDREQCVKLGNSISSWKKLNRGLPQGTKLGPLLFIISFSLLIIFLF